MSNWTTLFAANELNNGERRVVDFDDTELVIFNIDGEFYALEDICSHDGGEIASGDCENGEIICPRHGARFCIKTGQVKSPPAYEAIESFIVRVENGQIQIQHRHD